jgi:hypothetical protein
MTGTIIPAFSKRAFDFSSLAGSTTVEFVMIEALDLSHWTTVSLWVRVHSVNVGSTAAIEVIAYPIAPSVEQPEIDFVDTATSAICKVDSGTSAPGLLSVDISSLAAPAIQLRVKGTQASSPGEVDAELSAEIVAKAKGMMP